MQGREEGRDPGAAARATAKEQAFADFTRKDFVCADAHKDVELVKNIYSALVQAGTTSSFNAGLRQASMDHARWAGRKIRMPLNRLIR